MKFMLNLENVNNALLLVVIVLLIALITMRYSEKFQDTCNSSLEVFLISTNVPKTISVKVVTSLNGNKYKCGYSMVMVFLVYK